VPDPGYLGGGAASIDDARRVARHLCGAEALAGDALARADVDRDGAVTAADLLLLLRLASGALAAPVPLPRLAGVEPRAAAPGARVRVAGSGFGVAATDLVVVLEGAETELLAPLTVADDALLVELPATLAEGGYAVRVLRRGVASNPGALAVTQAPVLAALDPYAAAPGATIALLGSGFGSNRAAVSVHFGSTAVSPAAVSDGRVDAAVPTSLAAEVDVTVEVAGRRSEALRLSPLLPRDGVVALPVGSPLDPATLAIAAADGQRAAVHHDGTFSLALSAWPIVELTATGSGGSVLTGFARTGAAIRIDGTSTAVSLVERFVGGRALAPTKRSHLLDALEAMPEVTALATALAGRHPARPLLDQLVDDAAVRPVLATALVAAVPVARTTAAQ
jgi:hypothetical protein